MIIRKLTVVVAVLSVVFGGANAFAKESQHGSFTFVENKDHFDDSDQSFIFTASESSTRGAALLWKCMSDGLNVVYMHGTYFGGDSDNDILVRYRIDENEESDREYWRLLQGKEASYIRMSRVSQFTEEAKNGTEARFEAVDPLDGERLTDVFSLAGLTEALEQLDCYQ